MTRKLEHNVFPLQKDKYYVYALFKPSSIYPFYIGKGIGNRINNHFKKCNLKINTPKTGIIKKYGNSIKREILCYFDKEEKAYEFEEYLIDLYKLENEGGCLVNYAKTRFQYSDRFIKDVSSKGYLSRQTLYTKEQILYFYKLYFVDVCSSKEIENNILIPKHYQFYLAVGAKWKNLYKEYIISNKIINNRKIYGYNPRTVSLNKVLEVYFYSLINPIDKVVKDLKISRTNVYRIKNKVGIFSFINKYLEINKA